MACGLLGDNPLSEPLMVYCQSEHKEHIPMKFELKFKSFQSRKCIWKCRLPKWRLSCLGLNMLTGFSSPESKDATARAVTCKKLSWFKTQIDLFLDHKKMDLKVLLLNLSNSPQPSQNLHAPLMAWRWVLTSLWQHGGCIFQWHVILEKHRTTTAISSIITWLCGFWREIFPWQRA